MKIGEAVAEKLLKECKCRDISINKLANICGLTQSTVQNLVTRRNSHPSLISIVRICDGLEITLQEFFSDELFENIDRED